MWTPSHAYPNLSEIDTLNQKEYTYPMDTKLYNGYSDYLSNLTFTETMNKNDQQLIRTMALNYFIKDNILYR